MGKTTKESVISDSVPAPAKRHRRRRRGGVARQEVRKYEKSTGFLLKRAPFRRLIAKCTLEHFRELTGREGKVGTDVRITASAREILQQSTEAFLQRLILFTVRDVVVRHKRKRVGVADVRYMYALLHPQLAGHSEGKRETRNSAGAGDEM